MLTGILHAGLLGTCLHESVFIHSHMSSTCSVFILKHFIEFDKMIRDAGRACAYSFQLNINTASYERRNVYSHFDVDACLSTKFHHFRFEYLKKQLTVNSNKFNKCNLSHFSLYNENSRIGFSLLSINKY